MPAVPTFAGGARLDGLNFLVKPPIAKLRQTTIQAIPNATVTPIMFNLADVDTDMDGIGGHSTVTNTSRYVARYPGWYWAAGGVSFANNSTGVRVLSWAVNGSMIGGSDILLNPVTSNSSRLPTRTSLVFLAENDYLELRAYQTSGGSLNTAVTNDEQPTASISWESS
ncbi:hypothetical protein [Micromonospora zamorensis]|uniref:hypothetical protein n=1 Tax=Micromonospora zamorensis TaxID=709883 RepID=UPI0037988A3E